MNVRTSYMASRNSPLEFGPNAIIWIPENELWKEGWEKKEEIREEIKEMEDRERVREGQRQK